MKRAIVTGANGFVGKQLIHALAEQGYFVCAVVRSIASATCFDNDPHVVAVTCEMADYRDSLVRNVQAASGDDAPDLFFHLAWDGSAGARRADYTVQLQNVAWTCDAVRCAAALGCKRFIGAGSIMEDECSVYLPQQNAMPDGSYHYRIAKYAAHMMAEVEAIRCGIPFLWGKISNAYGESDTTDRFINTMLHKLVANMPCALTEGKQLYDFIYITELARAFVAIGERGRPGACYYIGSGQKVMPLRDYVEEMHRLTGSRSQLTFGTVPYHGPFLSACCFDSGLLKTDTGFESKIDFPVGIQLTLAYLKSRNEVSYT